MPTTRGSRRAPAPAGTGPGGRLIDRLRGIGCDSGGHSLLILDGPDADILYIFNEAYERNLLITGWPATDMGLPATTTYARFDRVSTKNRRFVLRGQLRDVNGERLDFISKGEARMLIPNHILIATEGDNMPQLGLPLASILGHEWGAATDDEHRVIWTGLVDAGGGDLRTAAFLAKKWIALEGASSPVPGRRWGHFPQAAVDIADVDNWTLVARLDESDPATAAVIVRNGKLLRQAGQSLEAIAPHKLTGFGDVPALTSTSRIVLWYATTDHPDPGRDEVLFLDGTALIREGVTRFLGQRVVGFGAGTPVYRLDPPGNRAVVRVVLEDGREVALSIDLDVGMPECDGGKNSLGRRAKTALRGFRSLERNTLALRVRNLPVGAPVVLMVGPVSQQIPFGNTFWCVGDNPLRLAQGDADAEGSFTHDVDLRSMATRLGLGPGDRVTFQLHYLDPGGPVPANLSSAKRMTLQ